MSSMNLKLNIIGRRKPGTTLAEHRHHLRRVHGKQVLRYVRSEPEDPDPPSTATSSR